jgi:hypothetical protein
MFGWLGSLFHVTPIYLHHLGFVREAKGIQTRYRHCKRFWAEHIQHCREAILQAMAGCQSHRKAAILGAGLLHDVPLQELSARFEKVLLVDVVHPFGSRWRTRKYRNVQHLRGDVTNCLEAVYEVGADPTRPLPESNPTLFLDDPEIDFTVSLNLLSQLPCMPMSYLRWQGGRSESQLEEFARVLIQAHLDYLQKLPGKVLLITDIERQTFNLMGQITEVRDLLFGLKLPKSWDREWVWKLAPAPEVSVNLSYFRRVIAMEIAKR